MSDSDAGTSTGKIASKIDDFPDMDVTQVGFNLYFVSNVNDQTTGYMVDVSEPSCTCPDTKYNVDEDQHEICKHLAKVAHTAPTSTPVSEQYIRDASTYVRDLRQAAEDVRAVARSWSANGHHEVREQSATDSQSAPAGDSVPYREADPENDEESKMETVYEWHKKAADFNGDLDTDVLELTWAEYKSKKGIVLDCIPWEGEYYEDGDWVDKDGFEDVQDAFRDLWNKQTDDDDEKLIEWHGEPDYVRFLPANNIPGVVS